jgi:histidinol dehydrogenase
MRVVSFKDAKKFANAVRALERRAAAPNPEAARTAARILKAVRRDGDKAVLAFAKKFGELDNERCQQLDIRKDVFRIPQSTLDAALTRVSPEFRSAVEFAASNIRSFAEWQKPQPFSREIADGVRVGQMIKPLDSVGCYVPGGRYPLPSTMLMTVIPAQVAGVERIVVVSPKPALETLATAAILGVKEFYAIGGAHAIAALAYGTKTVTPVLKIVGPGNSFVTAAKQIVAAEGACSIDMLAGPTEALIAAEGGDPAMLASDLVSQAEHDPETSCVFVTSNVKLAKAVEKELKQQSKSNKIASVSLKKNGLILITENSQLTTQLASRIASEHTTVETMQEVEQLRSAGSIFVGDFSAQAFGDYVSGPNHTLPTGALARVRGGLSVYDYLKIVTVQEITREGAQTLAPAALALARAEGLNGHAASIEERLNQKGSAARA